MPDDPLLEESKKRIWILILVFLLLAVVVIARLIDLQVIHHGFYKGKSIEQRERIITLAAPRGDIFDRNGNLLATSIDTYSMYAVPHEVKDKKETADKLSGFLNQSHKKLLDKLNQKRSFVWLQRKVEEKVAQKIEAADLSGICFLKEKKRVYPKGSLASQVLGFAGVDNQGLSGVELGWEGYLKGEEGKLVIERDPTGRQIITAHPRIIKEETSGMDIELTIDETLQYIAERELEKAVDCYRAISGTIIIMDPRSGEILSLASKPDFDPNNYQDFSSQTWATRGTSYVYEPGSTFKPVTLAAGLEEGVINPQTIITCPDSIEVGGRIIENSHRIPEEVRNATLSDILSHSINTGAVQIALRVGPQKFMKYIKAFGFGEATGVGLPGESRGILAEVKDWAKPDIGMLSFGQSIAATPLQLITAISVLANDGVRVKPILIKKVEAPDRGYVKTFVKEEVKQVISSQTAEEVKRLMEEVVVRGTGKRARIKGFRVAAKTGTAQKPNPYGPGYWPHHYVSVFAGFVPVSNPQVAILVMIDDPQDEYWGATVAAPIFKKVAEETLRYLDIPPDGEV